MDYYPFPDLNNYAQSIWPSPFSLGVQPGSLNALPTQGAVAHLGIDKYAVEHMIALATGTLLNSTCNNNEENDRESNQKGD